MFKQFDQISYCIEGRQADEDSKISFMIAEFSKMLFSSLSIEQLRLCKSNI